MESGKTSVTWEHFLDKDARVTCTKQMDESISCNALRAKFSGPFDRIHLSRFDPVENGSRLSYIICCCSWHIDFPYKNILSCCLVACKNRTRRGCGTLKCHSQ